MKSMIFFELKKVFSMKKTVLCAGVVFALLCAAFFARAMSNKLFEELPAIKAQLEANAGEVTPEKFDEAKRKFDEIVNNPDNYIDSDGEQILKPEINKELLNLEPLLSMKNANEMPQKIIKDLQKELTDPTVSKDRVLLIQKNIDMLGKVGNIVKGYNLFYDFYNNFLRTLFPYLIGFLILFFLAPVFNGEYGTKMDGLILSSKRGKHGLIAAKILSSTISVTAIFAFVMGSYILICGGVLGFSGGETSLSTMYYDGFQYLGIPYNLTMFQFLLFSLGISYLSCIGFGVFTLFVSAKCRKTLTAFGIGIIVYHVPLLFCAFIGTHTPAIANLFYGRIVMVAPMLDSFRGFVIFGNVVMLKELSLAVLTLASILFVTLSYFSFKKRQVSN